MRQWATPQLSAQTRRAHCLVPVTANRMTVVQAYVCDTHHHCLSSPGILPPTVLDLLVQAVAINSAYTSKVLVSA